MKRLVVALTLVALVAALFTGMIYADPIWPKLIAGQSVEVGGVKVWNDEDDLHVEYKASDGFCLNETHLHVADSLGGIPQTKKGNPIPGHFDYGDDDLGCVDDIVDYVIPLEDGWVPGTKLFIAAHAVVGRVDCPCFEETAWGVYCGQVDIWQFPGRNWATYIEYTVQAPE